MVDDGNTTSCDGDLVRLRARTGVAAISRGAGDDGATSSVNRNARRQGRVRDGSQEVASARRWTAKGAEETTRRMGRKGGGAAGRGGCAVVAWEGDLDNDDDFAHTAKLRAPLSPTDARRRGCVTHARRRSQLHLPVPLVIGVIKSGLFKKLCTRGNGLFASPIWLLLLRSV